MAFGLSVKLRAFDNTREVDRVIQRAVWEAVRDTAIAIENDVKGGGAHAAPYRTGNLRRSYHVALHEKRLAAQVGTDDRIAPYAVYVEFGTSRQGAQPHLRPAADAQRTAFLERARANLKAALRGLGGPR